MADNHRTFFHSTDNNHTLVVGKAHPQLMLARAFRIPDPIVRGGGEKKKIGRMGKEIGKKRKKRKKGRGKKRKKRKKRKKKRKKKRNKEKESTERKLFRKN
eukprot:CAMPEP_0201541318 /NCGR_PEP_ID=MMETSP0161_2-20130828/71414_1 /ASSEMBLY_ACC=CAM_ASM_000251 /TAXON_ID=180227 /ORGANISM="Neoparamoeba aestuarina, Strain SoJaBio B1-5/56/2" /LENGTH=100 /DNA_ID=CAMNT_0047948851 /DNA_START=85 /DNA_END=387 /DNA_ORIENTATION=-